jgi:hypothetical protein
MENNIPTAESFYDKKDKNGLPMSFNEKMIEFAKYHVEQALKAASQTKLEANYDNTGVDEERYPNDKSLILNAYPLTLIK